MVEFQPQTLTTPDLVSVAYCCVSYLFYPPHPVPLPSNFLPPHPLSSVLPPHGIIRPPRRPPSLSQNTEIPRPPFPQPSLPETNSSSPPSPPPRLPDSHRRRSHAASEISFNLAFKYCYADACRHHSSRNLPPPSYPISFAQTLNIVRR